MVKRLRIELGESVAKVSTTEQFRLIPVEREQALYSVLTVSTFFFVGKVAHFYKKNMKQLGGAILIALLTFTGVNAQISSNIQVGFLNTFGDGSSCRSIGLGGGLTRALNEKLVLGFSANLYFGGKLNITDTAHAYSGSTTPQTVEVEVVRKVIAYSGQLELKYYFVGDAESDMGVYASLGAGAVKMMIKTKSIGEYDASKYGFYDTPTVGSFSTSAGLGPVFGIGYEKNIGNQYFFVNGRFHLPVFGEADADAGFTDPPKAITLEAGLRFPF